MSGKKKANYKKKPRKSFNCDQCDKVFAFESKLKKHFNQVHIGARPFECPECGQAFKQKIHLNGHVKNVHAADQTSLLMECTVCEKMVKNLSNHMIIHDQEKQHKCPVCSKKFHWSQGLKRHIRIHTKEKPYYCQFCLQTFRDSSTLKSHERIVHLREKRFQCSICSKTFGRKHHLLQHSKIHSTKKKTSTAGNASGSSSKMKSQNIANPQRADGQKTGRNLGCQLTLDQLKRVHGLKDCSVVLERIDHEKTNAHR